MDDLTKKFISEIRATGDYDRKQIDVYVKQWQNERKKNPKLKLPQFLVQRKFLSVAEARRLWNIHRKGKSQSASGAASEPGSPAIQSSSSDNTVIVNGLLVLTGVVLICFAAIKFWPEQQEIDEPKQVVAKDYSERNFKNIKDKIERDIAEGRLSIARTAIDQLKSRTDFSNEQREELLALLVKIGQIEQEIEYLSARRKNVKDELAKSNYFKVKKICDEVLSQHPNLGEDDKKWFTEKLSLVKKRIDSINELRKSELEKRRQAQKDAIEERRRDDIRSIVLASLGPVKLVDPKPIEAKRKKYFPLAQWRSRVEATKKWIVKARVEQKTLRAKEAKQAILASKKRPVSVDLTDSLSVQDATVKSFDDERFSLASSRGEFGFRWNFANSDLAYQVRKLAVIQDSAESNYRFGRFCVKLKKFGPAKRAFARAIELRPEYKKRVPDLNVLEKAATVFHGKFRRIGGSLVSYDYDFSRKEQLSDFQFSWKRPLIKSGSLVFPNDRKGVAMIQIANVKFSHQVKIRLASKSKSEPVFFIQFTSKDQGINVYYFRKTGVVTITDVATQKPIIDAVKAPKGSNELEVSYRNREIRVKVRGRRVASLNAPKKLDDIVVRVGGFGKNFPFLCSRLRVEGKVPRDWLTKTFKLADDAISGLLADNGIGAPFSAWVRKVDKRLSAEDPETLRSVPKQALKQLLVARQIIENNDVRRMRELQLNLFASQKLAPKNPLVYYELGTLAMVNDRFKLAIAYFNRALELCGGFHEALAQRARTLVLMERYEDAQKDLDRAFAIRPDSPQNFLAQAILYFYTKQHKKAKDLLELGVALTPRDATLSTLLRNSTFVIDGPPWDRSYKVETEHYIVMSDISQKKTQFYADHLEWIYSYYKRTFPMHKSKTKAIALIFKTNEGYYQYSNLTANDRVEWTAGVYRDLYNQLLLFEDPNGDLEETIETLYHEGFHQFVSKIIRKAPAWLNEGFADYFAPTRFNEDGRVISSGGVNNSRLGLLKEYLRKGYPEVPFQQMMKMPLRNFQRGNVALHYCQSWAMIHFFRHNSRNTASMLNRYFQLLREGNSSDYAFDQTYGKLDLQQLQADWKRFILKLK